MAFFKDKWKGLLKLAGPFLFIFFFLKVVDPVATLKLFGQVRIKLFLASFLVFPLIISMITLRWWLICTNLKIKLSFKSLFEIYCISWFLGVIPVSGVAAVARIFFLEAEDVPFSASVLSITIDKIFDVLGLMVFGLFTFLYFPRELMGVDYTSSILVILLLTGIGFAFALKGKYGIA